MRSGDGVIEGLTAVQRCCDRPAGFDWAVERMHRPVDLLLLDHSAAALVAMASEKDVRWAAQHLRPDANDIVARFEVQRLRRYEALGLTEHFLGLPLACEILLLHGIDPVLTAGLARSCRFSVDSYDVCRTLRWARLGVPPNLPSAVAWMHLDHDFIDRWAQVFGDLSMLMLALETIPWDVPVDRGAYGREIASWLAARTLPDRERLEFLRAFLPPRPEPLF